jgi:hypothetical protein
MLYAKQFNLFISNKGSNLKLVYDSLKKLDNLDAYKKAEIPDNLHYKNNVRNGDILIVAKLGYIIFLNKNQSTNWIQSKI